jgi:hypothetical protein
MMLIGNNISPYAHALVWHVPEFLEKYGGGSQLSHRKKKVIEKNTHRMKSHRHILFD